MMRIKGLLLSLLCCTASLAQPSENLPPPVTDPGGNIPYANCDNSTQTPMLTANDFQCFLNRFAAGSSTEAAQAAYNANLDAKRPLQPAGLQASVAGSVVTLTWIDPGGFRPYTNGYVICDGQQVGTFPPGTITAQHSPSQGTHSYSVTVRNIVPPYTYAPTAVAPTVAATVGTGPPPPTEGWTDLTPPAGAQVFYASWSTGADTNQGTQAAPFKTINKGLSVLRNGQPDQLLLMCGDTWTLTDQITLNKSANSTTKYMVIGSYGNGPRPRIRTPGHGMYGGNNSGQHNGLAIVGLDLAPIAMTAGEDGIILLSTNGSAWDDVLIEDCQISKYSAAIVAQTLTDGHVFKNLKIRRTVIFDCDNNGSGHSQGIFLGGAVTWLIEECLIDNTARSKADMFCHNLYAHEICGPGIFRGNISSRACSHGGQQRPGGTAEDNLFLQNPINFYIGGNSILGGPYGGNQQTFVRRNVALDSRDINATDKRGEGFNISGATGSKIEWNVAAHQNMGSEDTIGFGMDNWSGDSFQNNAVYNWKAPQNQGWATSVQFQGGSGNFVFQGNKIWTQFNGMMVRFESPFRGTYSNNSYATATGSAGVGGYMQFAVNAGQGVDWTGWKARATENGSTFSATAPVLDVSIGAYMNSINMTPTLESFIAQAKLQSKQNWRTQFTGKGVGTWVRSQIPGMSAANP